MMQIRVLLAEDHHIVRAGIKLMIDSQPDMTVIGEAANGDEALAMGLSLAPDIVLMDVTMPGTDTALATQRLKGKNPEIKVLVLTRHDEDGYLNKLISAGADGYMLKQSSLTDVVEAVRTVCSGGSYIDPALVKNVIAGYLQKSIPSTAAESVLSPLETNVLKLVAFGNGHRESADHLNVSIRTVENARKSAMKKLNLESRVDIVKYAINQGWLHDN
jgi:two-component system response regulator NreC